MNSSLLDVQHASYTYPPDDWRLCDVSFQLAPGQILGIIGPNGAGKSTLLKITAGILPCPAARIQLAGHDLRRLSRRRIAQTLGYLPQNVSSIFDYSVQQVVAMGRFAQLSGAAFLSPRDNRIIEDCLEQTETASYRHRPLSHLSGGERQRVLLASVLAQQPRLLLLDEPTTGLDLHHQVAFFSLLARLAAQQFAVAVVTHDLNLAAAFCHRLLLLHAGRTVTEGPVEHVIQPDVLGPVYRHSIHIARHPLTDKPIVLPAPSTPPAPPGSTHHA